MLASEKKSVVRNGNKIHFKKAKDAPEQLKPEEC